MEETFQRILSKVAQKSGRSRLEPYSELIEQLRRRGLTYRDISDILTKELQVHVPKSTVNDFVRAQARERRNAVRRLSRRESASIPAVPLPPPQHPGMQDRTITICGLGKTFAVTGWRVGYCIASPDLTDALRKVHDFTTVCAPTPLQEAMAAVIGLPDSYYQWLQAFYASRRARMLGILDKHGFKYAVPEGAYYVMADFRHLGRGDDDMAFAYWLIDEIGVATVPGSSFYASSPTLGRGLVRFAFPKKDQTLDSVEERFEKLPAR
jgi:aspartate/methionine/tyrosine aminotransferase